MFSIYEQLLNVFKYYEIYKLLNDITITVWENKLNFNDIILDSNFDYACKEGVKYSDYKKVTKRVYPKDTLIKFIINEEKIIKFKNNSKF